MLIGPHSSTRSAGTVLLGTVALEPNRWGFVDRSGAPATDVVPLLPAISAAGFDGLELWERHLPAGGAIAAVVLSTYAGFDDPDPTDRLAAVERVTRTGAAAVKFNVGNDPAAEEAYVQRVRAWVDALPPEVVALCECHAGISIAEDPATAARIFDAVDRPGRVQAIVHTHESEAHLRERFAAYGPLITHVHVNFLDTATLTVPRLADRADELRAKADLLAELGFAGSWTVEFVHGLGTDDDRPEPLLAQAVEDLAVLRDVIG